MLFGFITKIREHGCRKSGSYSNDESLHNSRYVSSQGMDLLSSFLTLCNSVCVSSPAKDGRKIDSTGE